MEAFAITTESLTTAFSSTLTPGDRIEFSTRPLIKQPGLIRLFSILTSPLGSTGKAAVLDAALGLYRTRGKREVTLKAIGRDFDETELALQWDAVTCCWQSLGDAGQVRKDTFRHDVILAIQELETMGELPTTTNIARHLGKNASHVSREITELLSSGLIVKGDKEGRQQPYYTPEGATDVSQ